MVRSQSLVTGNRSFVLALALCCSFVGSGCGNSSGSAGSGREEGAGEIPAVDILEVLFGRTFVESQRADTSGCNLAIHRLRFADQRGGLPTFLSNLRSGEALSVPGLGGPVRVEPGDEICVESALSPLTGSGRVTQQCLTIESDTEVLDYRLINGAGSCNISVETSAVVSRFDIGLFCRSSCQHNINCGRIAEGCVESCTVGLTNASPIADPVCHDGTREALTCLNQTACVGLTPAQACDTILRSHVFRNPGCPKPLIPLRLPPNVELDPARCHPGAADLVSGRLGDFATISRTRDHASSFYLQLNLSQLVEVDAALAASPNDPILESAGEVVAALRDADQTSIDACEEGGIFSFEFTPPVTANFSSLDAQIVRLQDGLEALMELTGAVKREATAFLFDQVFCPATGAAFGGGFKGIAAQAVVGCFN